MGTWYPIETVKYMRLVIFTINENTQFTFRQIIDRYRMGTGMILQVGMHAKETEYGANSLPTRFLSLPSL